LREREGKGKKGGSEKSEKLKRRKKIKRTWKTDRPRQTERLKKRENEGEIPLEFSSGFQWSRFDIWIHLMTRRHT